MAFVWDLLLRQSNLYNLLLCLNLDRFFGLSQNCAFLFEFLNFLVGSPQKRRFLRVSLAFVPLIQLFDRHISWNCISIGFQKMIVVLKKFLLKLSFNVVFVIGGRDFFEGNFLWNGILVFASFSRKRNLILLDLELRFCVGWRALAAFEHLFNELERFKSRLKIKSYGLSDTTLEEIFLKVCKSFLLIICLFTLTLFHT